MLDPITVVWNPVAGRGRGRERRELVENIMAQVLGSRDVRFRATESPGHAKVLAREAVETGSALVVGLGGDGTLMEVAEGVAGTVAVFAAIPSGTGNDFCRTLGIGDDPLAAVQTILAANVRRLDLGRWECSGNRGLFLNVAGAGFDAQVAKRINEGYRFVRGRAAYLAAILGSLASFRPVAIRLEIDGSVHLHKAMLCAVANARSYGGGMRVAPEADLEDGLLDVVVVGDVGRLEFLRQLPSVFSGRHLGHPKVSTYRVRVIALESEDPVPVLVDGEVVGTTPARFEVWPQALPTCMPTAGPGESA